MDQADDTRDGERGTGGDRNVPRHRPRSAAPEIIAHQSDGGHTAFRESGNSNAWIATDDVVAVQR